MHYDLYAYEAARQQHEERTRRALGKAPTTIRQPPASDRPVRRAVGGLLVRLGHRWAPEASPSRPVPIPTGAEYETLPAENLAQMHVMHELSPIRPTTVVSNFQRAASSM
jgi:hypothetical protein